MSSQEILWDPPPQELDFANGDVHVFCASLDQPPSRIEQLAQMLSEDEKTRAARFLFEADQKRFVAARGQLREILGWLLGVNGDRLAFAYGASGKPALAAPVHKRTLHFNLAHSNSLAVYAVARELEIGIDLERLRPVPEVEAIVGWCFSPNESAQWRSASESDRLEAFFNGWTRKEAYLKAGGEGLQGGLDQVEVSLLPGEPARVRQIAGDSRAAADWSLETLVPAFGYLGAVAVPAPRLRTTAWKWPLGSGGLRVEG